ncbi:MAG: alkaline phosphatase family protein [Candidatus Eisenbacteria bacterium]
MKPVMVVLFVDALGWRLCEAHPGFAPGLQHRRAVATILGFSSGALPTAFTGRMPEEHGRFLMYRRAGHTSVFAGFERLAWLPKRLQRSWRLSRLLTRLVEQRGVRGYFNLYDIPPARLAAFDLPEQDDIFRPGGLPVDSIWDSLERRGLAWQGWNWRTRERDALAALLERVRMGNEDMLFLYTAELDATLHHEGSKGVGVQSKLDDYNAWLASVQQAAGERGRPLWLYLCSDHGMVDVTRTSDVRAVLARLPERDGRDYDVFLDSTMARFWWRRDGVRERVRSALGQAQGGHWLRPEELSAAQCAFADHAYGEDLFLLDPGVLMVPSYMGSRPLAAMHGYDASHPDMVALLASNRPIPVGVSHLHHLRGFLEHELDALQAVVA